MAHDCPECGELCYCDLDDVFFEDSLEECIHQCGFLRGDDDFPADEEEATA